MRVTPLPPLQVRWDGDYPTAAAQCIGQTGDACTAVPGSPGSCLCDVELDDTAPFTDLDALPTAAAVLDTLRIGAPTPPEFAPGVYSQCMLAQCVQAQAAGVLLFLHNESAGLLDRRTLFRVMQNGAAAHWAVPA